MILRLSNVYGVGGAVAPHAHMVTRIFATRAVNGEPLTLIGDGVEGLDLVHVRDVVRFVEEVVRQRPAVPVVLNVSAGTAVPLRDLAELVRQMALEMYGRAIEIRSRPRPVEQARPTRWLANERAQELAPWFPEVSLADGLREMLRCAAEWAAQVTRSDQ